ncbi:MAG: hypothetical protein IJN13_00305 [Bacilli bacterium]|nr:hypothetical protein [Bacilli bacterium]
MTKKEVDEFFKHLNGRYPKFEFKPEIIEFWGNKLLLYDSYDVQKNLESLMYDERYQNSPPQLEIILKNLPKALEKTNFASLKFSCKHCKRSFLTIEDVHEHEDRCNAIRYIARQYKRLNLGEFDNSKKRELYNMQEEAFDQKYKKLLRRVQEFTNDELEKIRIEFIFNVPTANTARKFVGDL